MSVLRVVYGNAVVNHAYVFASHAVNVYCLEASYSAVILYLNSREKAYRVGHAVPSEALQLPAFEYLCGNCFAAALSGGSHHGALHYGARYSVGRCGCGTAGVRLRARGYAEHY